MKRYSKECVFLVFRELFQNKEEFVDDIDFYRVFYIGNLIELHQKHNGRKLGKLMLALEWKRMPCGEIVLHLESDEVLPLDLRYQWY